MTAKQERFCVEYMVDLNATQAAVRAGYSEKGAKVRGCKLLTNVNLTKRIATLRKEQETRTLVEADDVIKELALLGFANMRDYIQITDEGEPFVDLSELTREQASAISEVVVEDFKDGRGIDARDVRKVRFKLHDKRGPLTDLAKHLGLFVDRHHHVHEEYDPANFSIEENRRIANGDSIASVIASR